MIYRINSPKQGFKFGARASGQVYTTCASTRMAFLLINKLPIKKICVCT